MGERCKRELYVFSASMRQLLLNGFKHRANAISKHFWVQHGARWCLMNMKEQKLNYLLFIIIYYTSQSPEGCKCLIICTFLPLVFSAILINGLAQTPSSLIC